ncbi:MAG: DUF342 domain-containing protein, partial [Bacteroidetes bacterium]|nr:DUF342 domain-containing protein [Bacteroidota bacterium]
MSTKSREPDNSERFLQPELGFRQENIKVGRGNSAKEALVAELVRKDAILAHFPNYAAKRKKGYLRTPMESGKNVVFDEQAHALVAAVSGYPRIHIINREDLPDLLVIDILPCIKITHNKMQASMVIHPRLPETPHPSGEDIDELIAEAGITHGIDHDALAKIQQIFAENANDFDEMLFAQGTFPGEGEDARLHFELEIGPLAGHLLDDDTIDFRDRKIMVGVKEGQHVATKIPAVFGS